MKRHSVPLYKAQVIGSDEGESSANGLFMQMMAVTQRCSDENAEQRERERKWNDAGESIIFHSLLVLVLFFETCR